MLTMSLRDTIGVDIFRASDCNYREKVMARDSIPNGIRAMIIRLFERGTITACEIAYGDKMTLLLSRKQGNKQLLLGGALERFQRDFAEITGERVVVTWEPSGNAASSRRKRDVDRGRIAGTLLDILDAISDGVVLAASIKDLFGGG
jgi:hypothetical protein